MTKSKEENDQLEEEGASVLGEPALEADNEAGATTTPQEAGATDGPADQAADGFVGLTRAAVAAVPLRDGVPRKRSHLSTEEWVKAQGEDGKGGHGDDEHSDGWTEIVGRNDDLAEMVSAKIGRPRQEAKSAFSRFFWS